jgi:hypothetical protein
VRRTGRKDGAGDFVVEQVFQVIGAVFVLSGFILSQLRRLETASTAYLVLNLVGAGILAIDAAIHFQVGFLLLEGTWAMVAGAGLIRRRGTAAGSA